MYEILEQISCAKIFLSNLIKSKVPVFLPAYYSNNLQEALSVTMQSAIRAASSGPCIVLLPSADEWFSVVSPSVTHVVCCPSLRFPLQLQTALDSLSGSTPIMLLATVNSNYEQASDSTKRLFRFAETVRYSIKCCNHSK